MQTLNLVTWNMFGFRNQAKRAKIIDHLIKLKADICFIQETHLTNSEQQPNIKHYHKIFSSTFNSKQRGVSILVSKTIPFALHKTAIDPDGRFIIINAAINHTTFTFANIYDPNCDDPSFFHSLFSLLCDSTNIIAGDFYTVLNPSINRSSIPGSSRNWHPAEIIKQYMDECGLGDGWRMRNPLSKEYTYFSPLHQSNSRIDNFFLSSSLIQHI